MLRRTVARLALFALLASLAGCETAFKYPAQHLAPLDISGSASAVPWRRYVVDPAGSRWPQTDWSAYNSLAKLASPRIGVAPKPANGYVGDAERGRALVLDRSRGGGCITCHVLGATGSQPGNAGPDLSRIGTLRTPEQLFKQIYEPRRLNPESIMPPWGTHGIFTVDEIRDVVAFLLTLHEPATFKSTEDDPAMRAVPVEKRDNLDPTENPASFEQDSGAKLFREAGANGMSCASCHTEPAREFRRWVAGMPRFEPRVAKVLGVEEFITRHARATTGANYLMETESNLALSIYLRSFANGEPMAVDTANPETRAALQRGEELLKRKIGQLDLACLDCHGADKAGQHWMRGQYLGEVKNLLGHFPTWRTSRGAPWDIRQRFQWCNVSVRANELPPDAPEYGDLELALTALNAGRKISVPGIRH